MISYVTLHFRDERLQDLAEQIQTFSSGEPETESFALHIQNAAMVFGN